MARGYETRDDCDACTADTPSLPAAETTFDNFAKASECAAAALIIVYRFRNNLFHGTKWGYGIRGQFDNFRHANDVLMAALDVHC